MTCSDKTGRTTFHRSSSGAFADDDWDAATVCVDPIQQPFVLTRNCKITAQYGGDTQVVSHGTLRVALSTDSVHDQRPREEFKL